MYKLEKEIFEGKEIEVAVNEGRKLYLIKDICPILGFKKQSADVRRICRDQDIVSIGPKDWEQMNLKKIKVLAVTVNGLQALIEKRKKAETVVCAGQADEPLIEGLSVFSQDLIPTYKTDKGILVVIGRDLHDALGIPTRYNDWFKRMVEYGFEEGVDFYPLRISEYDQNSMAKNALDKQDSDSDKLPITKFESLRSQASDYSERFIDHVMTFDMSKHICMIQRTPFGMEIRNKLIELGKKNQQGLLASGDCNSVVLNRLDEISAKCDRLSQENQELKQEIMNLKNCPRTVPNFLPGGSMNVSEMAKPLGYTAAQLNQILLYLGIQKKTDRGWELTEQYRDKGYTVEGQKYKDKYGNEMVHMRWTAKGVQFVWDLLSQKQLSSMN